MAGHSTHSDHHYIKAYQHQGLHRISHHHTRHTQAHCRKIKMQAHCKQIKMAILGTDLKILRSWI